jgi:hypothetical protein
MWSPEVTGSFLVDTRYAALVTLTENEGWTFDGVEAGFFGHDGKLAITSLANSGVVIIEFPKTGGNVPQLTTVTEGDLTGKIPVPVSGEAPGSLDFTGEQYSGSITWEPSVTGSFLADTDYRARVILKANEGWTFAGVGANFFTRSGATTVTNAVNSGIVIIDFPKTSGNVPQLTTVDDYDLTDKVFVPVSGGPLGSLTFTEEQYEGSIVWSPSVTGSFLADTAYTATVTLTAKEGWTFAGVVANFFTYSGGVASISNPAGSGIVTIEFPRTTAPQLKTVTDLDLTGKIAAPVAGQPIPQETSVSGDQYTGTILWLTGQTSFAGGNSYIAEVTLTAKEGWTFDGVGANSFHHDKAQSVKNRVNEGEVLVTLASDSDSDGDGFSNDMETANGFDPNNKNDNPDAADSGSLTITKGETKKVKENSIIIGFTLGGFTGKANLYYVVAAQDAAAPALNTYQIAFPDGVTPGVQTLNVTDAVKAAADALGGTWRDGYDVYLALMQGGKVARGSVRLPKLETVNVGG